MKQTHGWSKGFAMALVGLAVAGMGRSDGFAVQALDGTGRLTYNTLNDGTNYNYRVEWAPSASGPWHEFGSAGAFWLNAKPHAAGVLVTNRVPMCYRVVATLGDYLCIDVSGGPSATSYPVTYYRTLADVPGGPNSAAYKTTRLLMRLIPKGAFVVGSPTAELARYNAEAQHQVTLTKDFYIGVFEVTQKQWERVMGTWPSYFNNAAYRDNRPVEQVSYYDIRENPNNSAISPHWPQSGQVHADSFMGKLRARTGLTTLDLPTESQWEYACRAGTATALNTGHNLTSDGNDPFVYWDAHLDEAGRYWNNGGSLYSRDCDPGVGVATVGSYEVNLWGLYDMHGNTWEWCLDWYGAYPGTVTDPPGAASGSFRVGRGGSWGHDAYACRSAYRGYNPPNARDMNIGFRLARTLP